MIFFLLNQISWYVGDVLPSVQGQPFGISIDSTSVYTVINTNSSFVIVRRYRNTGYKACAKMYEYPNYTLKALRNFPAKHGLYIWAISNNGLVFMKIDTTCNVVFSKLYNFTNSEINLKIFKFMVSQNQKYMKIDTLGNVLFSKSITYQSNILDNSDNMLLFNDRTLAYLDINGNINNTLKIVACTSGYYPPKFVERASNALFEIPAGSPSYRYYLAGRLYGIYAPPNFTFLGLTQNRDVKLKNDFSSIKGVMWVQSIYGLTDYSNDSIVDFDINYNPDGRAFLLKRADTFIVYYQYIQDTTCVKSKFYPPGDDFDECSISQPTIITNDNPITTSNISISAININIQTAFACPSSKLTESKNCYYNKKGIYDITGKKLNSPKGNIYIENGRKRIKVK
ncbi:MAG: hypothetical protein ABIL49_05980 [candidate division WOR-3 bacterium]